MARIITALGIAALLLSIRGLLMWSEGAREDLPFLEVVDLVLALIVLICGVGLLTS